jgi:hypothetical protein
MTLSGEASKTKTTGKDGTYTFTDLSNGTYTVTPSKSGYKFLPKKKSVTVSGDNVTRQNFLASVPKGTAPR